MGGKLFGKRCGAQGCEFNVKPQISRGSIKAFSAVSVDKANVILDTMKPAEDGFFVLTFRAFEIKTVWIQM